MLNSGLLLVDDASENTRRSAWTSPVAALVVMPLTQNKTENEGASEMGSPVSTPSGVVKLKYCDSPSKIIACPRCPGTRLVESIRFSVILLLETTSRVVIPSGRMASSGQYETRSSRTSCAARAPVGKPAQDTMIRRLNVFFISRRLLSHLGRSP